MTDQPLFIGIDAGGTKTRVQCSNGTSLTGIGVNLHRDGLAKTTTHLTSLIQQVVPSKKRPFHVCAGIAGAGLPADQAKLQKELTAQVNAPNSSIRIISDAAIAYYAAHKDKSGILLIAGTGSIFWARTKTGQFVRSGGWGSLLGDEGSGFQLGLAALRAFTHEIDGGPITSLSTLLCKEHGICDSSDVLNYAHTQKEKVSALAPLVLRAVEQEDAVAQAILADQLSFLSQNFGYLLLAHPHISHRISLLGGLTNNTLYVKHLQDVLLGQCPDLVFLPQSPPAVEGALMLARKQPFVGNA